MDEYRHVARFYDPLVGPFLRPIHRAMLTPLHSRKSSTLIDLCCGTGTLAAMAAEAGITATGVDLSAPMLDVARGKSPDVTFIHSDATAVPLEDASFDACTISFALHEKPLPVAEAILAETRRLIRPGGLLVVADYRFPQSRRSFFTGLGIRIIERMAGRDHFTHFRTYMDNGGTQSFLARSGLPGNPTATHLNGWVGLFVHVI
ncbi:class I SAM-dependent methyltransferase [Pseudodesulfovibrio sp. zrk46]|uniref:class I SAM-dependent methyltransferase n=1 Tax=Pseudodesulfovibrio sp. zrk46 TaxID=2725288 RepID=UPI001448F499|nr:class I SAM-dependent methyltransferase [Pseudodesulfovibrio sp. zrk46]QJB55637.1 methyltransferase domain-containing protein [Pseudodesulfovibrio sp. zrk46]